MLKLQLFSLARSLKMCPFETLTRLLLRSHVASFNGTTKHQISCSVTFQDDEKTPEGNGSHLKHTNKPCNTPDLVMKIVQQAAQFDVMVSSIPHTTLSEKVEFLLNLNVKPSEIVKLIAERSNVLHSKTFSPLVKELKSYGMKNEAILNLLHQSKDFHMIKSENVRNTFECLRNLGMKNEEILHVFNQNPNIVNMSAKQINGRLNELKKLFTAEHSLRLMKTLPSAITDRLEDITEKFMYVHETMGISQPQMISASLFHHSLKHVMARHLFLERAGLFKKYKKKDMFLSTNPDLKDIIDTSDQTFVKRFTNMSVQDYRTFCKLLENEFEDTKFNLESQHVDNEYGDD